MNNTIIALLAVCSKTVNNLWSNSLTTLDRANIAEKITTADPVGEITDFCALVHKYGRYNQKNGRLFSPTYKNRPDPVKTKTDPDHERVKAKTAATLPKYAAPVTTLKPFKKRVILTPAEIKQVEKSALEKIRSHKKRTEIDPDIYNTAINAVVARAKTQYRHTGNSGDLKRLSKAKRSAVIYYGAVDYIRGIDPTAAPVDISRAAFWSAVNAAGAGQWFSEIPGGKRDKKYHDNHTKYEQILKAGGIYTADIDDALQVAVSAQISRYRENITIFPGDNPAIFEETTAADFKTAVNSAKNYFYALKLDRLTPTTDDDLTAIFEKNLRDIARSKKSDFDDFFTKVLPDIHYTDPATGRDLYFDDVDLEIIDLLSSQTIVDNAEIDDIDPTKKPGDLNGKYRTHSTREIADILGFKSKNTITARVKKMQKIFEFLYYTDPDRIAGYPTIDRVLRSIFNA